MQKLMNSLFVMAPESYLSLDGETVVAKIGEKVAGRFPPFLCVDSIFRPTWGFAFSDGRLRRPWNWVEFFYTHWRIFGGNPGKIQRRRIAQKETI